MRIPSKITRGDSIAWDDESTKDNLGNLIDSTWTLNYAIRGPKKLDLVSSSSGSGWTTSIDSSASSTLTKGIYFWQAFAEKSGSKVTLGSGQIEVLEDLSEITTDNYDGRSQARKDLDAVQTAIRNIVTGGVQSYTIQGRQFNKINLGDLRVLESQLKFQVNMEEREQKMKSGQGHPFNLKVRF